MSYIPCYIRPVSGANSSSPVLKTSSSPLTPTRSTRSSTVTSTLTSPSPSVVSSTRTSPTRSMKDESIGVLPGAKGYRRYERRNTSYVGYREDYIRKQNDKGSGQKSLEERLKSLEAGASVTLQMRRGSRNRRNKSNEKDLISRLRSRDKNVTSPNSTTNRSDTPKDSLSDSSSTTPISSVPSPPIGFAVNPSSPIPPATPQIDSPKKFQQQANVSGQNNSTSNHQTQVIKPSLDTSNHQTQVIKPSLDTSNHQTQVIKPSLDTSNHQTQVIKPSLDTSNLQTQVMKPSLDTSNHQTQVIKPSLDASNLQAQVIKPSLDTKLQEGRNKKICDTKAQKADQKADNRKVSNLDKNSKILKKKISKPALINKAEVFTSSKSNKKVVSKSLPTEPEFNLKEVQTHETEVPKPSSMVKVEERLVEEDLNLKKIVSPPPVKQTVRKDTKRNRNIVKPVITTSDPLSTTTQPTKCVKQIKDKEKDVPEVSKDQPPPPSIISTIAAPKEVNKDENETRHGIIKPIPRKEKPVVLDVPTNDTVVPVELRSPRSGMLRGGGVSRASLKEKRNARVFVFPSSDDSETENVLSKLRMSREEKSSRTGNTTAARSHGINIESSLTSSSSSSLPSDGKKTTTTEDKSSISNQAKEQRRKSSRSPKRSASKRTDRSKSSTERSNTEDTEKIKHTRSLSGGSHLSSTVSANNSVTDLRMSPEITPSVHTSERTERGSTRLRYKTEYKELSSTPTKPTVKLDTTNLSSPRQQAVADAVKFGFTEADEAIPYIDDATTPQEPDAPVDPVRNNFSETAAPSTVKRAFPLSRDGRSVRGRGEPRRTSYKEAMESTNQEGTDVKWARHGMIFSDSDKEEFLTNLGKLVRSNSADSVLSTSDASSTVVVRRKVRSSSADRNSLKGIYRRSYQIATNQLTDQEDSSAPTEKHQASMTKLKNLFVESSPSPGTTPENFRRSVRNRSIGSVPVLMVNHWDDSVVKEGFLSFKVATIEKGKRTSAQKSWKLIWAVLKNRCLYLCKDWSRNKPDSAYGSLGNHNTAPSGYCFPPTELILEEEEPLNIQASLVSIAYNYIKRKHVFKVTTFNGSEYLFQAEDREEMLLWIHAIQVHGNYDNEEVTINEDLILRQTNKVEAGPKPDKRASRRSRSPKGTRRVNAPVKDVDGSRRFKWRGSVNRIVKKFGQGQNSLQGGMFDVLLEECHPSANNEHVPFLVDLCCRIVEQHGLSFIGIYRVPGNNGAIQALQEELNLRGPDAVDLENDDRFCDLNIVSSLLKSFFRKLLDPLFTNELYNDFIAMNRKEDPEERLKGLRRLIHMLPTPHYETLKFLITHLRKVADNASANKMEIRNLAIVFGPTLIRNTATEDMTSMVTDMSDQCRIIESVLRHTPWFFTEDEDEISRVPISLAPQIETDNLAYTRQLLANANRASEEVSDTANESSEPKVSHLTEKESFSRDVMYSIFGSDKKWTNSSQGGDDKPNTKAASDDEEFEFKSAQYPLIIHTSKSPYQSPPQSPLSSVSSTSQNQGPKFLPGSFKSTLRGSREHLPLDYHGRLREFFVESLEWLGKNEINRPFPHFSSSSAESSPQVTPRTSIFGLPQAGVQRTYPRQHRRLSEGKLVPTINTTSFVEYTRQSSTPLSSPSIQRSHRFHKDPKALNYWSPNPAFRDMKENYLRPSMISRSRSELSSRESLMADVESDSDNSVQLGNPFDDKLKHLSLPLKRHERMPRRKTTSENHLLKQNFSHSTPLKQLNKILSNAPDFGSAESLVSSKKSARELYERRKAQRRQYRVLMKTSLLSKHDVNLSRCTSDENVYVLADQMCGLRFDVNASLLQRQLSESQIRRRHTLGSGDFPDQTFWDRPHYASMQNITRDVHDIALLRLRPQLRSSAPSLFPITTSARFV